MERSMWIPVWDGDVQTPEVDGEGVSDQILLSFENFDGLLIGRYEVDKDGCGRFFEGDDDTPLTSVGLFANAWMPLPMPYREPEEGAPSAERREAKDERGGSHGEEGRS